MNQKMPFYGLQQGSDFLVALSRNRMYVNLMSTTTGDLVTTFKVGEDRFLDSLLVSSAGGVCVCGDETQKPFPLLVWDLAARKLIYDLRLPHHEFITRISAISDDGHFVVCACKVSPDSRRSTPLFAQPIKHIMMSIIINLIIQFNQSATQLHCGKFYHSLRPTFWDNV